MTDGVVAAIVVAVGNVAAIIVTHLLNRRAVNALAAKVEQVHVATNSLTDRLVESTGKEAHAAGVKEEKDRREGRPGVNA